MAGNVCSPETFSSSDAATSSSFTPASSGGEQVCPRGAPPSRPCDVEEIILNASAASRQSSYWLQGGRFVPESAQSGTRAISLCGLDRAAPRQSRIEVVAERRGATAVTNINVMVRPLASHDSSHVLVTVERPGESNLVRHCPAHTNFSFPVYRADSPSVAASIFERFFTLHLDPARYRVYVESCGIRNSGPPVGDRVLDVMAYPYDQYTLTFTAPPMGRRTITRAATATIAGTTTNTSTRETAPGASTTQSTTRERDGTLALSNTTTSGGVTDSHSQRINTNADGSESHEIVDSTRTADPARPTLELKKNGAAEDVGVDLIAIVRTLSSVERAVAAIRELVRSYVPQIGFRFEWTLSFMQGSLSMGWGWKENRDHQVYFGWSGSISMWIFKIGLSISFGFSAGPATLRVVGEIVDAGLNVTATWDARRPGRPALPPTARGRATLPAEIRGEAVLNLYVTRLSAAAGVRSGITAEGGTRLADSLEVELYANINWTGMSAFIRTERPGSGTSEDVYRLMNARQIYSGKMPI